MNITIYKVIITVEDDVCSWIVQACADDAHDSAWYTHAVSMRPYRAIDYIKAIADAGSFIFDKRYRVPVYHTGVKQPVDYLFDKKGGGRF